MGLTLKIGQCSLQGNYKEHNEDAVAVHRFDNATVCVLADGGGGWESSQGLASRNAVEIIVREVKCRLSPSMTSEETCQLLRRIMIYANEQIMGMRLPEAEFGDRLGTTILSAIWRNDEGLYITNVGDNRAYLVREQQIDQLTVDDTLAQALYEAGTISQEEVRTHRFRNVLWRYLGCAEGGNCREVSVVSIRAGDRLLLCTDGLWNFTPDEVLFHRLTNLNDVQLCADSLAQAALDAGSRDNVSCIVIDVSDGSTTAPPRMATYPIPATAVRLAESLLASQPCHSALHDALLDAGHPELAEHFREPEHLTDCWALRAILGRRDV